MTQRTIHEPWYHAGLRFECTGCGSCCTGAPGYVWVGQSEIDTLAAALGMQIAEFQARYVRRVRARRSLIELANGDCIFFDNAARRCTVYEARPHQCRTWPFWESIVRSPSAWGEVCRACPGCGGGPVVPMEHIRVQMAVVRV